MRKLILLIFLLLFIYMVMGTNRGILNEVLEPESIQVYGNELYVVEGAAIFVYSLDDLSLIRKFGKKGEGPGELKVLPFWPNSITVWPDYIFAEGLDKFIFFSKEGKLIKEHKKIKRFMKVLPVWKNFVVKTFPFQGKDQKYYNAIKVLNTEMEEIKELYRQKVLMLEAEGNITMIPESLNFCVYDNKIFVEESPKGFFIEIFDCEGKKLYQIDKKYKKIKVTSKYKNLVMDNLKESFKQKKVGVFVPLHIVEGGWENFKKWAKFIYPDYIPSIRDIVVDNEKIYVQTFNREDNKEEYVILDLKGNTVKKVYLPRIKNSAVFVYQVLGLSLRFYAINNNRFIYLNENEDDEEWEVHVIAIL